MSLSVPQLSALLRDYDDGLVGRTLPFWLRYGADREHGGLITGLDRDGAIIDTDKAVWLQGRAAWTFSTAYLTRGSRPEWLEQARSCLDFIRDHCRGPGGKLYFTVTREGRLARAFTGTMWIDEGAQEVMRVEATAIESIAYGYGLVARLATGTTVTLVRVPIEQGLWLPTSLRFTGEGRALLMLRRFDVDFRIDWFDYRRVG